MLGTFSKIRELFQNLRININEQKTDKSNIYLLLIKLPTWELFQKLFKKAPTLCRKLLNQIYAYFNQTSYITCWELFQNLPNNIKEYKMEVRLIKYMLAFNQTSFLGTFSKHIYKCSELAVQEVRLIKYMLTFNQTSYITSWELFQRLENFFKI